MNFSVEEENLICMYHTSDRRRTMTRMLAVLPDMDTEMRRLANGTITKLERIHYNCVGTIEIPSALPLPTPDVSVNTRKGVVVNYAPCDVAI